MFYGLIQRGSFATWIRNKYNHHIDATGLAWFRMAYALVFFFEVLRIWRFRQLIFEDTPFLHSADINWDLGFIFWLASISLIFLGLLTRFVSILNYLFSLLFIGFIGEFEYHVFYAYMGINFLLMFLPVSRVWSLDRLIIKLRFSNSKFHYSPPTTTSVFSYWIPMFIGVGLVYFDSIFFKLTDPIWLKGLGMWWPASHVCASYIAIPELLDQKWVMLFLGYLTIIFELVFIFLFYFKTFRWIFWWIGIGLHVGILIFFPIPFFALTVVALYILLLPVGIYRRINFSYSSHKVTFYYDGECPMCARTKIVLEHFDLFKSIKFQSVQSAYGKNEILSNFSLNTLLEDIHVVDSKGNIFKGVFAYKAVFKANVLFWPSYILMVIPGVTYIGNKIYFLVSRNRNTERCTDDSCGISFISLPKNDSEIKLLRNLNLREFKYRVVMLFLLFCVFVQCLMIYTAFPIQNALSKSFKESGLNYSLSNFRGYIHNTSKGFLGLTNHAVFGHYHFAHRDDLIKIEFVGDNQRHVLLPITEEDGRPGDYISGCSWVNWNFMVLNSNVKLEKFIGGIKRYTAFWLKQNFEGPLNGQFVIYHKTMSIHSSWEHGVLKRDLNNRQWKEIGTAKWTENSFATNFLPFD